MSYTIIFYFLTIILYVPFEYVGPNDQIITSQATKSEYTLYFTTMEECIDQRDRYILHHPQDDHLTTEIDGCYPVEKEFFPANEDL